MNEPELFIKDYSSASLLTEILVFILSLHVFSWEYALLELEVYTVLAQHFSEELAFDLFNKLVNGVPKSEVSFEGWMSMQVQVHE